MMTQTEAFQAEINPYISKESSDSVSAVIGEYLATRKKSLATAEKIGVGSAGQGEIRGQCLSAFIRRWMMLRYAAIDLSFTDSKHWVHVERTGRSSVELRDVFSAKPNIERDSWNIIEEVHRFWNDTAPATRFAFDQYDFRGSSVTAGFFRKSRKGSTHYPELRVHLHAETPDGITDVHRAAAAGALSWMAAGRSAIYRHGVNPDFEEESNNGRRRGYASDHDEGTVQLIWLPTKDSLSVSASPPRPKGDPLLVYEFGENSFVLDFFDTPDEESIESYVREFSEGSLGELEK